MMRFLLALSLLIGFTACVKKQHVVNRLVGSWQYSKCLNKDGTYTTFSNIIYTFKDGKADGVTYLDMTVQNDTVITTGKYLINKNASELYLMSDVNFPSEVDTLVIEDMDKKSLVGRSPSIVWYFYKQ